MSRKAWKASYPADIVRAAMTGAAAGAGKVEDVMRAKMAGMPGRGPWAGKSGNVVKAAKAGAPGEAAGPGAAEDTAGAGTAGNTAGAGTAGNTAGAGMSGTAGADGMQPCGVSAGRLQTDRKSAGYGSAKAEDAVRRTEGARRGTLAAEACRGIVWHEILGEPMCRRRRKR